MASTHLFQCRDRKRGEDFPDGKLGRQLALVYEVKLNGLEGMLRQVIPW
ncbi:DUF3820 family protein [Wenzhouxiangella sp. AB-CW3]|nr:DUF3820 family protein [Wenzhouxiangella sp. AB-CW3]